MSTIVNNLILNCFCWRKKLCTDLHYLTKKMHNNNMLPSQLATQLRWGVQKTSQVAYAALSGSYVF